MIWASLIWSLLRVCLTLIENKSTHRNRAEKDEAERNLRKKLQRNNPNQGYCDTITNFLTDAGATVLFKLKYLGIPMIKVLPSVIFRLLCFWLILSYCSEFYPNKQGVGPGLGLWLPAILIFLVAGINFVVASNGLQLKMQEAVVNSTSNLILPVYVDLFYLVSAFMLASFISNWQALFSGEYCFTF